MKKITTYFLYELLILMTGLTFVALSATIMSNILKTIYIYEVKAKGNYFRLVTLKAVHPNNIEFCPYDIAGTLDKQHVLAGYHSFVKSGQRIIVF